jgi:hypothetical protein
MTENQTLRAALKPFADAYRPELQTNTDDPRFAEFLDRNTITPSMTMGDFRRAYEALAASDAEQAKPVAWWIPKAEQFCLQAKDGSRPFAKAWEPLYATPQPQPAIPAAPEQTDLHSIEQYRMQMAGISTAALGYWMESEPIHPDYDTPALRDVAKLYAKYAALVAQQAAPEQVNGLRKLIDNYGRACRRDGNPAWESAEGQELAAAIAQQAAPEQTLTLKEVWAALDGNPDIPYTKEDVLAVVRLSAEASDECQEQHGIFAQQAAPEQATAGWKLVPIEPSEEMMQVYRTAFTSNARFDGAEVYRAMVFAAPPAQVQCEYCDGTGFADIANSTLPCSACAAPSPQQRDEPAPAEQPLACLHINQDSMDAAADAYEAEFLEHKCRQQYENMYHKIRAAMGYDDWKLAWMKGYRTAPVAQQRDESKDAERYRWLQEWYLHDGQRSEIDPLGHIRQTTPEIMDTAIDAAIAQERTS